MNTGKEFVGANNGFEVRGEDPTRPDHLDDPNFRCKIGTTLSSGPKKKKKRGFNWVEFRWTLPGLKL